jgi:hypothetical protein
MLPPMPSVQDYIEACRQRLQTLAQTLEAVRVAQRLPGPSVEERLAEPKE